MASKLLGREYPPGSIIQVGFDGGEYTFGK
jgi:hypothetical protein